MKKLIVLFFILIFGADVYCKCRVYTCNDGYYAEIGSACLASALLKIRDGDLLYKLLNNPSDCLDFVAHLTPENDLKMIKVRKKPLSFTHEDIESVFQATRAEFMKSDTILCLVSDEALRSTKVRTDFNYLNKYQYPIFVSSYFQRVVNESGAIIFEMQVEALQKWIAEVRERRIRVSVNPWQLLESIR